MPQFVVLSKASSDHNPLSSNSTQICPGDFALCWGSTCLPTNGSIEVNVNGGGIANYPEVSCYCPIIKDIVGIAHYKGGNMNGSCTPPPGYVWSLWADIKLYPQEWQNFSSIPSKMEAVDLFCPATNELIKTYSDCWSFKCARTG